MSRIGQPQRTHETGLAVRRGRVVPREALLTGVRGARDERGARTIGISVRRLRAKRGAPLPLVTLAGAGYKLTMPDEAVADDRPTFHTPSAPSRANARSVAPAPALRGTR